MTEMIYPSLNAYIDATSDDVNEESILLAEKGRFDVLKPSYQSVIDERNSIDTIVGDHRTILTSFTKTYVTDLASTGVFCRLIKEDIDGKYSTIIKCLLHSISLIKEYLSRYHIDDTRSIEYDGKLLYGHLVSSYTLSLTVLFYASLTKDANEFNALLLDEHRELAHQFDNNIAEKSLQCIIM
jgi:hypothetical protein